MHPLISFIIIFALIFSYLIFYHQIDLSNLLDVMHSSFTRQFIFELIPFIILFSTRDMKFIDISDSSSFFNSVVGRSMIGMIGFTFVTYSLSTVNPNRIGAIISEATQSIKLNSYTNLNTPSKKNVESYEKLLPYSTI